MAMVSVVFPPGTSIVQRECQLRSLFSLVQSPVPSSMTGETAVTVYEPSGCRIVSQS